MGRLFGLIVLLDDDITTSDVAALVRGLRLASRFHEIYNISLDALAEHYGRIMSGGAFANLFEPILMLAP